eukprot:2136-Heterococcus_DN1.PRE.6
MYQDNHNNMYHDGGHSGCCGSAGFLTLHARTRSIVCALQCLHARIVLCSTATAQQQQYYNDGRRDGSDNGYGHMRGGEHCTMAHIYCLLDEKLRMSFITSIAAVVLMAQAAAVAVLLFICDCCMYVSH